MLHMSTNFHDFARQIATWDVRVGERPVISTVANVSVDWINGNHRHFDFDLIGTACRFWQIAEFNNVG